MPKFKSTFRERYEVKVKPEVARAYFADIERQAANNSTLQTMNRKDEHTAEFVLSPQHYGVTTFNGRYTCRYEIQGDSVVWRSLGGGNIDSSGTARFTPAGDGSALDYQSAIEVDLDVNRILAVALKPVIELAMGTELRAFVERMIQGVEAAQRA